MRISELAQRAGVTPKAVRYYESVGLLDAPRSPNGYREFAERDVEVVAQIRDLVALGVRAEDARPFVDCLLAGNPHGDDCPESLGAYVLALATLDERIAELNRRRETIAARLDRARGCTTCGAP